MQKNLTSYQIQLHEKFIGSADYLPKTQEKKPVKASQESKNKKIKDDVESMLERIDALFD